MKRNRDIGRDFERVDEPPVKQPPDYTDYPSGDVKIVPIAVVPKVTSVIPQEGLAKRKADIVAISKEFQGLGEKPPSPPVVIHIKPTLRIDVAKTFKRVDEPPFKQPPDYTDFPSGDVKAKAMARVKGLISQEGLMKRRVDINFSAFDLRNEKRRGGLVEGDVSILPVKISPMKVRPVSGIKPVKNFGFLASVDKFFIWLNKILGE